MADVLVFPDEQQSSTTLAVSGDMLVFKPVQADLKAQDNPGGSDFIIFEAPAPSTTSILPQPDVLRIQDAPQVSAQYEMGGGDVLVITSAGGPKGEPGPAGPSAYDLAVQNGFSGTQNEWLASLKGDPGPEGPEGPEGPASTVPGPQGKSAYQVAVDNGFVGTEAEWVQSLIVPSAGAGLYYSQTIPFAGQAAPRAVTYDTVLEQGAGFTADPLTGIITVSSDGWYSLAAHIRITAGVSGTHSLYVTYTGAKTGTVLRGSTYLSATMLEIMCVGDVFLQGGDQLQVWYDSTATTQITGNADGSYTYFRIVNMQTGPQGPAGPTGPQGLPGSNFILLEATQTVNDWITANGPLPDGALIFQKA